MNSGIYLLNLKDMYYVGSAKDFNNRFDRHLADLKLGKHHNIILQRAFDKYPEETVKFSILHVSEYDKQLILEKEQYFIDQYKSIHGSRCCNISGASFGDVLTNHPNKKDIIKKRSETQRLNASNMSNEEKSIKFGRPKERNGMFGKTHTDEVKKFLSEREISNKTREKMSIAAKEKFNKRPDLIDNLSNKAKEKTGDKNNFFGKKHSLESKAKMSKALKGKKPINRIAIEINNVRYESYGDASNDLGIAPTTIRWRCLSKNEKFSGYKIIE
jgi:group I intron endonuclease